LDRKIIFFVLLAVCLGFSWGSLSITHNIFPKPQLRNIVALITQQPSQDKHNEDWQTRVSIHKNAAHKAKVAMVGDSITQRTDWADILDRNDVDNRGIGGDTSTLILKRIDSIYKEHYSTYVLMFGINDFFRGADVDDVYRNYQTIVSHLTKNHAQVVIQSTLFCNPSKAPFGCYEVNQKIKELNHKLRLMNMPNSHFVDINSVFSENESLKSGLSTDGIHLNLAGYQTWAAFLSEHILLQYN
jgi:lysophospholipase L1-like esterase